MSTYILKGDEQSGPYGQAEILGGLSEGRFSYDDLAWRDGLTDWQPLRALYPPETVTSSEIGIVTPQSQELPQTQLNLHALANWFPDASVIRAFFSGYQSQPETQAVKPSIWLDIFVVILWLSLIYPLWFYPIVHGVSAAKKKGISPNWMWFGIHPLFGWIAFAIISRRNTETSADIALKFPSPNCDNGLTVHDTFRETHETVREERAIKPDSTVATAAAMPTADTTQAPKQEPKNYSWSEALGGGAFAGAIAGMLAGYGDGKLGIGGFVGPFKHFRVMRSDEKRAKKSEWTQKHGKSCWV